MARSLRDELLKAGLVTSEQVSRAERGSRPTSKPTSKPATGRTAHRTTGKTAGKATGKTTGKATHKRHDNARRRAARHAPGNESNASRKPSERRPPAPVQPPGPDPEERIRQLNLEIRRILDTEAEKVEAETDTPFHFARGDHLKRLYVSEDQRRRLSAGELAIVGFRGRHHLVPRPAGERVRELRSEVFVFIAGEEGGADAVEEEGYEGYEIPDDLVW